MLPLFDGLCVAGPRPAKAAGPLSRWRKSAVWALIVVATLFLLIGSLAIWVQREVVDTKSFNATTTELLRNPEVQSAMAAFLVDQIYENVDVEADIEKQLPDQVKGLAGPAAAALYEFGTRAATRLLGTPPVIRLVQLATRAAHAEFLRIVDSKPGTGERVYLELRPIVLILASRLGIEDQVVTKLPADAGRFVVLDRANRTIDTVQKGVRLVRALSLFLLLLVVAVYGFAIWLARGWRREAILRSGAGVLIVGLLLLVFRKVLQGVLLDALVGQRPARPAVGAAYQILTGLLAAVAWTAVAVGLIAVVFAFLAGPSRIGHGFRAFAAPALVRDPWIVWSIDGLAILVILIVAPIDDRNKLVSRLVTFAVMIGLTEMTRRRAREEHPDGGWHLDDVRRPRPRAAPAAAAPTGDTIGQLERLTALRDRGAITEEEFGRMKAPLVQAPPP